MAPEVNYETILIDLLKEPSLSGSEHGNQPSIPKIQKVQPYLRQRKEFGKYYFPKLLSIGPIHHGDPNLKLGEHYKKRWTKAYFEDFKLCEAQTEAAAKRLHQIIASNIEDLKKWYSEDAIKEEYEGKDNYLTWMLFVDGCSLLHIINIDAKEDWWKEASEKLKIKIDQLALLLQDLLLLENQLPYKLLSLLTDDKYNLAKPMLKLLQNHNMLRESNPSPHSNNTNLLDTTVPVEKPLAHLLDLMYKTLLNPSPPSSKTLWADLRDFLHTPCRKNTGSTNHQTSESKPRRSNRNLTYRVRNIQELKAAGIHLKSTKKTSLEGLEFKSHVLWGRLHLPETIADDFTAPTFLNLIAYEMCPDFPNKFDISSYVSFLDMLIDHPDDVKELRSAGVLQNHLGSDEEVAKLFNTISTDLIADWSKYAHVRDKIQNHCENKWMTWAAQVWHDHFRSPWTVIAFLTVLLVTGLTIVQTWYTIKPPA